MNLSKLFEMQRELDTRIVDEKGLEGRDLLPEKILALQVELGELANEWRSFKFWSTNQTARNQDIECHSCKGKGFFDYFDTFDTNHSTETCTYCDGTGIQEKNPLLTEYVDCLHFILSIGLEINFNKYHLIGNYQRPETITEMFLALFEEISTFSNFSRSETEEHFWIVYSTAFEALLELGKMLGFTRDQIESAYYDKNKVNHSRQINGY